MKRERVSSVYQWPYILILCSRMFVLQQIRNTNLVMVVVQADCDCSRQYSPITLDPKEVKYILSKCYVILYCVIVRV